MLVYHNVPAEVFASHVDALQQRYNVIPLRQFVRALKGRDHLPERSLVITIDDGFKENYELRGVVGDRDVPVTLFVSSQFIGTNRRVWWQCARTKEELEEMKAMPDEERLARLETAYGFKEDTEWPERQALSRAEVMELAKCMDVQSHGRWHPVLVNCPADKAEMEISGSKRELEDGFGLEIYAFSYPIGANSNRERDLVRNAGYECAVTVEEGNNTVSSDLFSLKRIPITDDADINELLVKASGLWRYVRGIGEFFGVDFNRPVP